MASKSMKVIITDLGAKGDAKTLNTEIFQKAVDICSENGGGTIVIPPGVYIIGTVELKSNLVVYLEAGAVLKGSEDIKDYRPNGYMHNEWGETYALLYAIGQSSIRITGTGEIDLSGITFMDFDHAYECGVPEEELDEKQFNETCSGILQRPNQPIFFHDCNQLWLDEILIRNSPCWTITFSTCRDIAVKNIIINNHLRIGNSDGIHFCSCKDAIVTGCNFSCGDDCIAITGITNWKGISERIVISDCIMRSRSAGVRLGHLASKVRNVLIQNLIIYESNRGINVFVGNDGWVKDVTVSNLIMDTHIYAGTWWGKGEPLVICAAESEGVIDNISLTHVKTCSENGVVIIGDKYNIRNITLDDWIIQLQDSRNRQLFGKMIDLRPAPSIPVTEGKVPWLYADKVANLQLRNICYGKAYEEKNFFDTEAQILEVIGLYKANICCRINDSYPE